MVPRYISGQFASIVELGRQLQQGSRRIGTHIERGKRDLHIMYKSTILLIITAGMILQDTVAFPASGAGLNAKFGACGAAPRGWIQNSLTARSDRAQSCHRGLSWRRCTGIGAGVHTSANIFDDGQPTQMPGRRKMLEYVIAVLGVTALGLPCSSVADSVQPIAAATIIVKAGTQPPPTG